MTTRTEKLRRMTRRKPEASGTTVRLWSKPRPVISITPKPTALYTHHIFLSIISYNIENSCREENSCNKDPAQSETGNSGTSGSQTEPDTPAYAHPGKLLSENELYEVRSLTSVLY